MPLFKILLQKLKISKKVKIAPTPSTETAEPVWNCNVAITSTEDDVKFTDDVQKYENLRKKESEKRKTLRRQNRFLGLQNEMLAAQNQKLSTESHKLKVERQTITAKKNEMARRLRKQKRISEYYRRKLAEVRQLEAAAGAALEKTPQEEQL